MLLQTRKVDLSPYRAWNCISGDHDYGHMLSSLPGLFLPTGLGDLMSVSSLRLGGFVVRSGWLPIRKRDQKGEFLWDVTLTWSHLRGLSRMYLHCQFSWGTVLVPVTPWYRAESQRYISTVYLPGEFGIPSQEKTEELGLKVKEYPGLAHSAFPEELEDLPMFFRRVIPASQ